MQSTCVYSLILLFFVSCAANSEKRGYENLSSQPDLIHSDLPLFNHDDDIWPRPLQSEGSFGCTTRIALGDWKFEEQNSHNIAWYKIQNYGVFHCWALLGYSDKRSNLEGAEVKPTHFVFLGQEAEKELWAAQIGVLPGSDYLLLARAPSEGIVESFDVLQRRCPAQFERDAGTVSLLQSRYCAINTQADLVQLARQMVNLPPVGTLVLERK